jgi:hypothetical protein
MEKLTCAVMQKLPSLAVEESKLAFTGRRSQYPSIRTIAARRKLPSTLNEHDFLSKILDCTAQYPRFPS